MAKKSSEPSSHKPESTAASKAAKPSVKHSPASTEQELTAKASDALPSKSAAKSAASAADAAKPAAGSKQSSSTKASTKSATVEVAAPIKVRARLNSKVWRATSEVIKAVSLPKRAGFAKLESIPVFADGYALGDLVMTDNSRDHFILEVIERSGNSTFRVKFLDRWPDRQTYEAFWSRYNALGCTANPMESVMLLAINSPPSVEPRKIADMLTKDQANYDLEFEATYQHGSK